MNDGPTVSLPARQLFSIPDAAATRILCTEGCVWLTLDGDLRDVILHPGDSFEAREPRRALLYAMEPCAFSLTSLPPPRASRAAWRRPHRGRSATVWAAVPA